MALWVGLVFVFTGAVLFLAGLFGATNAGAGFLGFGIGLAVWELFKS
jgi:hypothetical protein